MARLIIPDEQISATFTVTSSTSAFAISFAVLSGKADLRVTVDGVELEQADFTFSGTLLDDGGYQGGTVTLNDAVDDVEVVIWRDITIQRATNFSPSGSVPVRTVDNAFNRLTAQQQDLKHAYVSGEAGIAANVLAAQAAEAAAETARDEAVAATAGKADIDLDNVSTADLSAKSASAASTTEALSAWLTDIEKLRGTGTAKTIYVDDVRVTGGSIIVPVSAPTGAYHRETNHEGILRAHPTPATGVIAPAWLLYGKDNATFPGWHFIDFHENGRMPFRVYDEGGFYSTCGEIKPDGDWHIPGTITSGPIGWRNPVLNGGLNLWSRGSSGRPDGWYQVNAGGTTPTWSQQAFTPGQTDVPNAGNYFLRMTFAGTSSGSTPIISNRMEGVEQWAGRTVLVQAWVKSTTYPTTTVVVPYLIQRFGSGGSAAVTTNFSSVQITDAWARVCFVANIPSISGKTIGSTASSWEIGFGGTIGQTDQVLDIANLQIDPWEVGRAAPSASSPYYPQFQRIPLALQQAMASRYYQAGTVRTENGSRWIGLSRMLATPIMTVDVGSAANASTYGFELSHTSAAACAFTATAELA